MNIYVGNLPFNTTSDDLVELFSRHGAVSSAQVISDRDTGRSRGFGFVEIDDSEGHAAIEALHDAEFGGRRITVNEAKPREERRGGGGGGGGGGGRRW